MGNRESAQKAMSMLGSARHIRFEGLTPEGLPKVVRFFYDGEDYVVTDDMVELPKLGKKLTEKIISVDPEK